MDTQRGYRIATAATPGFATNDDESVRAGRSPTADQLPDSLTRLVHAARAGDQESWNALVDRFLPLVTAVIARYRLQPYDADDVNQTVWLRLVERLHDLREPRALAGWLVTATRNESLNVIRRRGRDTPVDPQAGSLDRRSNRAEIDSELIREERATALREATLGLSPPRRELIRLLTLDPPMSYDEISARLGIPKGSIGPTRARILGELRTHPALRALAATY